MALFVVNSAADSGSGTLRQAISDASGGDTIAFDAGISNIILTSGEIHINKSLTIDGPGANLLTISGNHASRVFHVSSGSDVTIHGLLFTDGSADYGGAVYNDHGTLTIASSTFSGNIATVGGGAIFNDNGTFTITNSTLSNNTSDFGGAIFNDNDGTFTITNSTLSNNTSDFGGATFNGIGTFIITNSTLSGNTAVNAGGAVLNFSTFEISFSTIAENQSAVGAGVNSNTGRVTVKNSIVGNNHGQNYEGAVPIWALGVNFATDGTCPGFTQVTSAMLNLGPLALNAPGTTETHALLNGSAAIDSVTLCTDIAGNAVTTDQRGVSRPQGIACDAGAYEAKTSCRGALFIEIS